jgi:hypothetical protein
LPRPYGLEENIHFYIAVVAYLIDVSNTAYSHLQKRELQPVDGAAALALGKNIKYSV